MTYHRETSGISKPAWPIPSAPTPRLQREMVRTLIANFTALGIEAIPVPDAAAHKLKDKARVTDPFGRLNQLRRRFRMTDHQP